MGLIVYADMEQEPGYLPITPSGATANAVLYTLVETAKTNGLDTYEFLKYLLQQMLS